VSQRAHSGFTLVEVLVALMVVALGLAALLTALSSAPPASSSLHEKTLAQWIALNRISEVRLMVNRIAPTNDTARIDFGNRTWHYDTRYFDTSIPTMKRITVRVWAGDTKSGGNPVAEATGFIGQALSQPGGSNVDWTQGSTLQPTPQTPGATTSPQTGINPGTTPGITPTAQPPVSNPSPPP
jgi:general secretion pathway protein I